MSLDGAYAAGVFDRLAAQGQSRRYVERVLDLRVGAADQMAAVDTLAPEELALLRIIDTVPLLLELFDDRMTLERLERTR